MDDQQGGARLPTTGPATARTDGRGDMTEHHGRHGQRMGPLRAADTDRQEAVDRLGTALREGRLDLAEYDERLRQAYAARTYHELDDLLTDLPPAAPEDRGSWQVRWVCCLPVPYRQTRAPGPPDLDASVAAAQAGDFIHLPSPDGPPGSAGRC